MKEVHFLDNHLNKSANNSNKSKGSSAKFMNRYGFNFALAGFCILCLYPIFSCWYYGDDAVTRDLYAYIRFEGNVLMNQFEYSWVVGRFYPLHILQRFVVFYIFRSIESYRVFILVMNVLAFLCFAAMVKCYSESKKTYAVILLFYPGIFLFLTRYDDAVTSYYMFVQALVIYLSVSLMCLWQYLKKRKVGYLVVSVFLYLLSLLTYESSYLLVFVYPLALYHSVDAPVKQRLKKTLKGSVPYFITAFLCFLIYLFFSFNADSAYQGVTLSLDIRKITTTFLKQIIASFPVVPHAYILFNMQGEVIFDIRHALANIKPLDIFSTLLFITLSVCIYKRYPASDYRKKGFLLGLAALLVVCPSLVIAFSAKYQEELIWGLGYLPIYITRFGLLLLFYIFYEWVIHLIQSQRVKKILQLLTVIFLAVVHLFSLQGNRDVLLHKNQSTYKRQIVEQSVNAGLFNDIPENSIILLGNSWYDYSSYNRNSIYSSFCDKPVRTDIMALFIRKTYETYQEPKTYDYRDHSVYYFDFAYFQQGRGYAYLGRIDTLSLDETEVTGLWARELNIFELGNEFEALNIQTIEGKNPVQKRILLTHDNASCTEVPGLVDMLSLEWVKR